MVLPSGTEFPPPAHAAGVVVAVAVVLVLLARRRPRVDARTVLAFAPWMATGAALYVGYGTGLVGGPLAPLASSPTVYLTTLAAAGAVWLVARRVTGTWSSADDADGRRALAAVGTGTFLLVVGLAAAAAVRDGSFAPLPSVGGLVVALAVSGAIWAALGRLRPEATAATGGAGALVIFGHVLDGVSTAVGVDLLSFGEQTPVSRFVLEVAAGLPTAPYVGSGWLFVVVKLVLAAAVVVLVAGTVREEPTEGFLLLGVVAALGLGPGVHNLVLFAVVGSP